MPTALCYHCGMTLTSSNRSQEHIIPNAIGGRWKSGNLLCSDCNTHFGNTIDSALCRDLASIASLLDIDRERGENQLIKNAVAPDGERFHMGRGLTPINSKPIVEIDKAKQTVHISARNKTELLLLIKQLKQKYPNLDDHDLDSKFVTRNEYVSEPLTVSLQISGPAFTQAVIKMAVNAWLENTGDLVTIATVLNDLHRPPDNMQTFIRHYYTRELCETSDDDIEHIIYIKGEPEKSLLYAYVELFSSFAFIINLNENYAGKEYSFLYRYNVLTGMLSDLPPVLHYTGALPQTINLNSIFISLLEAKLNRVLAIADERAKNYQIVKIAEDAFKSVMDKYPRGTDITDEMVEQIETEAINRAKAFAAHLKTKK